MKTGRTKRGRGTHGGQGVKTPEMPEMPANWEDCSRAQLEWLEANGTSAQRIIARRYLQSENAEPRHPAESR